MPMIIPGSLSTALLGSDPRQRTRLKRSLLAACLCLVAMAVLLYGIEAGFVARLPGGVLLGYLGGGLLLLYAALRSGWSLRWSEPGLTLAQMIFAVTGMTAAYSIAGPARGGFLLLLACAMAFGGFTQNAAHTRAVCVASLSLLAVVMVSMVWFDPARYPPTIEAIHFVFCLVALPTIAAVSIELCRAREKLKSRNAELSAALVRVHLLASSDELTGLPNRRQLDECLDRELLRVHRHQTSTCVCLLDLDHFKQINDSYGHAAGDLVLREFARVAKTVARGSDMLGRWGGEEFLWVLPDTVLDEAQRAVERLRQAFALSPLWRERPELERTFSAGLAVVHPRDKRAATLDRVDAALYKAKQQGRDRMSFGSRAETRPGELTP